MDYPEILVQRARDLTETKRWEGFVRGEGPKRAQLMLIGESPGAEEVAQGHTFVGKAGSNLNEFIHYLGIEREQLFVTNTTKSRPLNIKTRTLKDGSEKSSKSNRAPSRMEIQAHAPLLDYEIQQIQPKMIITLGNIPLKRILGDSYKISDMHGHLITSPVLKLDVDSGQYENTEKSYQVFPLYHPAAIIYRRELKEVYYQDLEKLKGTIK